MGEKRILLNNVSVLANDPIKGYKRKVLKNLNLNLESNKVISIVSSNNYDRLMIGKVLTGEVKPTEGEVRRLGDYFNNRQDYRGEKFSFITREYIDSIKNERTIDSFIKENILSKRVNKENYEEALKEYKEELSNLMNEKNDLESEKRIAKILYQKKKEELEKQAIENIDDLSSDYRYRNSIKEYNDYIDNNLAAIKHAPKRLDKEIIHAKEYYLGKEDSLSNFYKGVVATIKEIRRLERLEVRATKKSGYIERDIENLVFSRTKRELKSLLRYLNSMNKPNLQFEPTFIKKIEKLIDSKQSDSYYKGIESCLKDVAKLTSFTNEDISSHIKQRISFMKNILNPRSPINSREFNNLLNTMQKWYDKRKEYFAKALDDIELQIEELQIKNKKEKINAMREVWEHKIISLRFQAQIYRERAIVIDGQKATLDEKAIEHNEENANEIYKHVLEEEKTLNTIDIALNRWRFKREVSLLKLTSKIYVEELKLDNFKLKKEITKFEEKLIHKENFESHKNTYIQKFLEENLERINKSELKPKQLKEIQKRKKDIDLRIEELQEIIANLENKMDVKYFDNEELALTYLLDDISFDTDLLQNTLEGSSVAQKQRLALVKSVLEGKEVIILEDPKYDLDLSAKSEIATSIKNIVSKHNIMIILLTNDVKLAQTVSNRIAFMDNGTVYEKGKLDEVMWNPTHPFTKWIIENTLEQKYGGLEEFDHSTLKHSQFSILKNHVIGKDHTVFCTDEELKEWGAEKWEL